MVKRTNCQARSIARTNYTVRTIFCVDVGISTDGPYCSVLITGSFLIFEKYWFQGYILLRAWRVAFLFVFRLYNPLAVVL